MTLDLEILNDIIQQAYLVHIQEAYGSSGIDTLKEVMKRLRELYAYITPDLIRGALIVFRDLDNCAEVNCFPNSKLVTNLTYFAGEYDTSFNGITVIKIQLDGTLLFWKEISIDMARLSEQAIVYRYQNKQESFIIKGRIQPIRNPSQTYSSIFARPTFRNLSEALENYKWRLVRTSRCEIFSNVWNGGTDSHRLFLINKPESTMRKSLTQYLHCVLRDADVFPEVNVDESHPVDVQVSWAFSNQLAIIEIKWMGDSLNAKSDGFTTYRESRANEGAKQLAEYLDAKHKWAPLKEVVGYLVVVDARRRGLTLTSTYIDRENGFWYQDREIEYNPEYHETRPDFKEPIRMFAEPICRPD